MGDLPEKVRAAWQDLVDGNAKSIAEFRLPPQTYIDDQTRAAARRLVTGLESLRARSTGSKASVLVEDLHELIGLAEWLADKLEEKST
jgi:hypothetical protein